jgi:glycine hydroxymethyltransferase
MTLDAEQRLARLRSLSEQQLAYENSIINLIASDNAVPKVLEFETPYKGHIIQEGIVGNRPFAGAIFHDKIENFAREVACSVFGAEHANLQPHSCSQANQAVYHAFLAPGDNILALTFAAGGHLTHGAKANFSGRVYNFSYYGVNDSGLIDYAEIERLSTEIQPKLIVCGSSSYPRLFDAHRLRMIADMVGAKLMLDLSHEAGLIAGGAIENPIPFADVATMSLDKTLRGPFGGLILSRREFAKTIDRAVHPGTQSSFPIRKLTESAHALIITQTIAFQNYARNVLANAKMMEQVFLNNSIPMITNGTDKHYLIMDVNHGFGISGTAAEQRLEDIGLLTNRQTVPHDISKRANDASGLRIGSPWATSRGYSTTEFEEISHIIIEALRGESNENAKTKLRKRVMSLVSIIREGDVWRD